MIPELIQRGSPRFSTPVGWQSLGKAIGHVWTAISSISSRLLGFIARIEDSIKACFPSKSPINKKPFKHDIKINPDHPDLKPIFEEHLLDQLEEQKQGQKGNNIKEEQVEKISPKEGKQHPIEIKIEEKPHSPPIDVPPPSVKIPLPALDTLPAVKVSPPAVIVVEQKNTIKTPNVIDVPDDGNCLFYACGVGLRTKYKDIPEIQEKLQWNVNTQLLTESLSKNEPLLREPGATLRQQAADYLETHLTEEDVFIGLLGGIGDYVEVANRKMQEEESTIQILLNDIDRLQQWLQQFGNTAHNYLLQIQEKEEQVALKRASIAETKKYMPNDENLHGYIDMTKGDHVYCGAAQVYAIAKFYDVPIAIISRYGEKDQQKDIYNAESPYPPIKLAFVNGNHYRYIDD